MKNKFNHFARQLQKTMKGLGTDDDTLVRVVVSRCEIDMVQIKEAFEKLTGQTLEQYIAVSSSHTRTADKIYTSTVLGRLKSTRNFIESNYYKR